MSLLSWLLFGSTPEQVEKKNEKYKKMQNWSLLRYKLWDQILCLVAYHCFFVALSGILVALHCIFILKLLFGSSPSGPCQERTSRPRLVDRKQYLFLIEVNRGGFSLSEYDQRVYIHWKCNRFDYKITRLFSTGVIS